MEHIAFDNDICRLFTGGNIWLRLRRVQMCGLRAALLEVVNVTRDRASKAATGSRRDQ